MFFLFATGTSSLSCSFAGVNANGWIVVNYMLVALAIFLGGLFWAGSNLLPPSQGEKLRGVVKAEIFQAVLGFVIVSVLVTSAFAWCNIGSSLTASSGLGSNNPMSFAEGYLQNLLFTKGFSLFGSLYSETALFMVDGILLQHVALLIERIEASFLPIQISLANSAGAALQSYATSFGTTEFSIFAIVSGILFVIYLTLPMVSSIALTVVVPTAIAMRMLTFLGPRIREASDAFLAIAIAAYFIFPLMIVMNSLLVTYLYTPCTAAASACNPYSGYLGSYTLTNLPVSSLFNTPPTALTGPFSISKNFFSGIISGNNGFLGTFTMLLDNIITFPQVVVGFSQEIALYVFQGLFLIGLDILVTMAFAQALARGLNSVSVYISGGGFWS